VDWMAIANSVVSALISAGVLAAVAYLFNKTGRHSKAALRKRAGLSRPSQLEP
jgi:hypothetical protein